MKRIWCMLLALCVISAVLPTITGAESANDVVYVSDRGSDTNSGLEADKPVKTLKKAFELVPDGGMVTVVDSVSQAEAFKTPAKAVTIQGTTENAGVSFRLPVTLGGDLTIQNLHFYFIEASIDPYNNERSIFVNGHRLTVQGEVHTENSGRYPSIFAGSESGNVTGNSEIHLTGGTFDRVVGSGKGHTLTGTTNVYVGGTTYLKTGVEGGNAATERTNLVMEGSEVVVAPMVNFLGNLDLLLRNFRDPFGAKRMSEISVNHCNLVNSDVSVTSLRTVGDMELPAGSSVTTKGAAIGGNFTGGGAVSLGGYPMFIGGTATGTTSVIPGAGLDGWEAITAAASDKAMFLYNDGRYELVEEKLEGKIVWRLQKMTNPAAYMVINTYLGDYDDPVQFVVNDEPVIGTFYMLYFDDQNIQQNPEQQAVVSLVGDPAGVSITQPATDYDRETLTEPGQFELRISPEAKSGMITLKAVQGDLVTTRTVAIVNGWMDAEEGSGLYYITADKIGAKGDGEFSCELISTDYEFENMTAYGAIYDAEGGLLEVQTQGVELVFHADAYDARTTVQLNFTEELYQKAAEFRLYLWNESLQPCVYMKCLK